MALKILILCIALFALLTWGCPENPEPPCTCRMIGYRACIITCMDVNNEVLLEKSLQSMRNVTVPILTVEIYESYMNYLPSRAFRGLTIPKIVIGGSSMVSLSETETAFIGLEHCLETLIVQEFLLFGGWRWSQLRNLNALTELHTTKAGFSAIDEDVKEIAHLNITNLFFLKDSISYIYDEAFSTFHNLRTLSLKMNDIKTMKRSMFPDPAFQLSQIILSYNQIESLPKDLFTNMPSLISIILSDNKLLTIDQAVFKPVWHQLTRIKLDDNPLRCDCRMSWLLEVPFPKNTWAECNDPRVLKGRKINQLSANVLWC